MTLNEIAYNIKNIVERGIAGEDSNLSIRQIKSMVDYHRAQLLLKYTKAGKSLSNTIFQTVSSNMTNGFFEIPALVGFEKDRAIREIILRSQSIIPANDEIKVTLILDSEKDFFEASRFAPFSAGKPYATLSYNISNVTAGISSGTENIIRIYDGEGDLFVNPEWIAYTSIIASSPNKVSGFDDGASNYPFPDELVPNLIQSVLSTEFQIYLRAGGDYTDNSMDDSSAPMAANTPNVAQRGRRKA